MTRDDERPVKGRKEEAKTTPDGMDERSENLGDAGRGDFALRSKLQGYEGARVPSI